MLALLLLLALAGMPASALAAPGDLDRSFGENGRVVRAASFGQQPPSEVKARIAVLRGGRIIVLAGRTLYAFESNGSIDRRFGGGAVKVADPGGGELQLSDIATDFEGRVLVAGSSRRASGPGGPSEYAFVARYTSSGRLDPSFGDGGALVTDFGLPRPRVPQGDPPLAPAVQIVGIAADPADRPVVTGTRLDAVGPCRGTPDLPYHDIFVARLRVNGGRDTSFGTAGLISPTEQFGFRADIRGINPPLMEYTGRIYLSTGATGPCVEGQRLWWDVSVSQVAPIRASEKRDG